MINNNSHHFMAFIHQPVLAGTFGLKLEDFVGAKFHCPHALADDNQRIGISTQGTVPLTQELGCG